jgi:hypothetical protein
MSPQQVFSIASSLALVSWIMLAILPRRPWVTNTNDGSRLSCSLSRESSQRTATEVQQEPAAPKAEPVSQRGGRPSEEEQGHSLGIGLA